MKKYRVKLSDEERSALKKLIGRRRRSETSARKVTRTRILLLADAGASDTAIVSATRVGLRTVEQLRHHYVRASLGPPTRRK
jgi:hypothetical protein